jgi:type VII secretion-associated serine protease mycosin
VRFGSLPAAATIFAVTAAAVSLPGPAYADSIRDSEWHIRSMRVAEANKISTGQGIIVAVIDTGVYPHADLRNNLLIGTSVAEGKSDNGQVDKNGHGTKMASLIAAYGKIKNSGVVGIAPEAKILPVRYTDPDGGADTVSAGKAIVWSANHGAKVINFSGAVGPGLDMDSAMKTAADNDAVVVAASGNVGQDVVEAYPAAMPGVLAVGASDKSGQRASISIRSQNMQICAPGVEIVGASPPNRYDVGQGTSDSTAIVSGAVALVRAKFPNLSAQDVIHRLTATATDIGKPGRDDECGYGVLNIVKALTANVPPLAGSTAPSSAAATAPTQPPTSPGTAAPETVPTNRTAVAVVGGVVVVLLLGGLFAFLRVRRRKTS